MLIPAADHARLKEHVSSMPGKLEAPIFEGGLFDNHDLQHMN